MRRLILVALAAALSLPAQAREVSLRSQCYGNRCVFYTADGRRVGSVTDYGYRRKLLQNAENRRVGTVVRRGNRWVIQP